MNNKSFKRKSWVNNFEIGFPLGILTFFVVIIVLFKIINLIDSIIHFVNSKISAYFWIGIITLVGIFSFYLAYTKLAPWIDKKISEKLDFPLSLIPEPIMIIVSVFLTYIGVSILLIDIELTFNINWLPNNSVLATLISIVVAIISYLGNASPKYVFTIMEKKNLVRNERPIESSEFKLWCTNRGGRTGNVKWLGWCSGKDGRSINFDGNLSLVKPLSFDTTSIKKDKTNESEKENLIEGFVQLKSGDILDGGLVKITPEMQEASTIYVVLLESTGNLFFKKVSIIEKTKNSREKMKKNSNKLKSIIIKFKIEINIFAWAIFGTLLLSGIYNLLIRLCYRCYHKKVKDLIHLWIPDVSDFLSWISNNYYNGIFLILTAIVLAIGILIKNNIGIFKKIRNKKLWCINLIFSELSFCVIKLFLDNLALSQTISGSGIILFFALSQIIASLILGARQYENR